MRYLHRQSIRSRIELFLAGPSASAFDLKEPHLQGFHSVRVLETKPQKSVTWARVEAIRQASARIVVPGEDHCYPEPEWAEKLVAAFEESPNRGAVGPVVANANPRSLLSWANYYACFGHWSPGHPGGPDRQGPWHNTAYRKDLLLAFGQELPTLFAMEGLLQEDLRRQGYEVYISLEVRAQHINISRLVPYLHHGFLGGRLIREPQERTRRVEPGQATAPRGYHPTRPVPTPATDPGRCLLLQPGAPPALESSAGPLWRADLPCGRRISRTAARRGPRRGTLLLL